jgi:hypothetical protein
MGNYPNSVRLGDAVGPDGESYRLDFYGESEGAAVIVGPLHFNADKLEKTDEQHREPATDADDARTKLAVWMREAGWSWKFKAAT